MESSSEENAKFINDRWVFPASTRNNKLIAPLVWIDLEMTGLDIDKDVTIEIACILTDGQLTRTIQGPDIAIKHGAEVFEQMGAWCREQHTKSGLVRQCLESPYYMAQAERLILNFIKDHVDAKDAILAGSSVHTDKIFLRKDMPMLHDYLHYRILDVSSVKELCKRWYPEEYQRRPRKKNLHRALSDIEESIAELRFYRQRRQEMATVAFREKRRKMEPVLATELREILDRAGGVAKVAYLARFRELLEKERRLKHRLTLLTVIQLTQPAVVQELMTESVVQILRRWLDEGRRVESPLSTSFLITLLELLNGLDLTVLKATEMGGGMWEGALKELQFHVSPIVQRASQQLYNKWTAAEILTELAPQPMNDPATLSTSLAPSSDPLTESVPPQREPEAETAGAPVTVSKRVEGLNSPLPRAFHQKPLSGAPTAAISKKRRPTVKKSVHWAPEETLVTIRTFRQTDPPSQLSQPDMQFPEPEIEPTVAWVAPTKLQVEADWKVQSGESSEERRIQTEREDGVVAVDPATLIGDRDPEEPYFNETQPQPRHQPLSIPLEDPKRTPKPAATSQSGVIEKALGQGVFRAPTQSVYVQRTVTPLSNAFVTPAVFHVPQPMYSLLRCPVQPSLMASLPVKPSKSDGDASNVAVTSAKWP